jgi:hypothetical protein
MQNTSVISEFRVSTLPLPIHFALFALTYLKKETVAHNQLTEYGLNYFLIILQ